MTQKDHPAIGRFCVIRTYSAGVHAGIVTYVEGTEVHLQKAYRIWRWEGAFTLTNVARNGITGGRIAGPVEEVFLTEAIEIIPAAPELCANLEKYCE